MREYDTEAAKSKLPDIAPPAPKMEDGIVLFYLKDGIIYPVAMTENQAKMLPTVIAMLGPMKVISNLPQGEVENTLGKKEETR